MLRRLFRKKEAGNPTVGPPALGRDVRRLRIRRVISFYFQKTVTKGCWTFYILGLIWLFLLPRDEFHHNAKADENALLIGQTIKYFSDLDLWIASDLKRKLQIRVNNRTLDKRYLPRRPQADYGASCSTGGSSLIGCRNSVISTFTAGDAEYLGDSMREYGLDAFLQQFTLQTDDGEARGVNAYGYFRAPRGDGTEAIVISAPWLCGDGGFNAEGVAYVMAFAKFVTRFSHWSKDFIFLVTPGAVGTHAWLEAYHGILAHERSVLQYDRLERHGGNLQEALNLEFCGLEHGGLGIVVDGLNGQLPNADLVTTVIRAAQYEGIQVGLNDAIAPSSFDNDWKKYAFKATMLAEYMRGQSLGLPTSDHALYARYHVEALTIRSIPKSQGTHYTVTGHQIGRSIETVLRSLNNLLERLHHAYWFYLMPTAQSFIPLSVYLPPVALLSVPLVFQSLACWWASGDVLKSPPGTSILIEGTKLLGQPKGVTSFTLRQRPLFLPLVTLFLCHAAGLMVLYIAPTLTYMAMHSNFSAFNVVSVTMTISAVFYSFMVPTLQRLMEGSGASTAERSPAWVVLKSFSCLELGAFLIALATLNPSLSIFLAILSVPSMLLAQPRSSHTGFALTWTLLTLASPLGLMGLISWWEGLGFAQDLVARAVDGWTVYGAWLLPVLCLVYGPINMVGHVIIGMEP
ncbi:Gaa1-like protein [Phlyctochytrium arcticum]|nr:Gaa1-like protein [Phlyctochytrium arcticum]